MWEIALVIAVIVFSITCFFLIQTLIAFQNALLVLQVKVENLSDETKAVLRLTESRLKSLDSTFLSISHLGDICESKTSQIKQNFFEKQAISNEENLTASEIAQWALTSKHLFQQIFKNRSKYERK